VNRRSFLKALAAGGLTLGLSPLLYGAMVEPNRFEVVEQSIRLPRLGPGLDGLRVAQISDLHMGPFFSREKLEKVVEILLAQSPDLILITGDFLTRGTDYGQTLAGLLEPLGELTRRWPVFSVMGNHDHYRRHAGELRSLLGRLGIVDVTNGVQPYRQNGDTLHIAGVGTLSTGHMFLNKVAKQAPADSAVVLLAHEPDVAQWKSPRFVMQFSGHTHGGQINLIGSVPLILPWMGKLYPCGLYDLDGFLVYTNRGLGMTRLPIRLNCPPEITVFTLRSA